MLDVELSSDRTTPLRLAIQPRGVAWLLGLTALALVVAHLFRYYYFNYTSHPVAYRLVDRFHLDQEGTIAVWFSSLVLLLCSAATAVIALQFRRRRERGAWRWWAIACLFLMMSADETASFHELGGALFKESHELSGYFSYGWVLLAIPVVAGGFVVLGPALLSLPGWIARRLLGAAGLYFGGAVGMEMVGGKLVEEAGLLSGGYFLAATAEESLEMAGLVLGLYTLLNGLKWVLHPDSVPSGTASPATSLRPDATPVISPGVAARAEPGIAE